MNTYRVLDANINRASEGLRVIEDVARFYYNNKELSGELKQLRHGVRKNCMPMLELFMDSRDSQGDVGLCVSNELRLDNRETITQLVCANFKRVQEALRTVEESLRLAGQYEMSKLYEQFRFETYAVEKKFFSIVSMQSIKKEIGTGLYCITAEEHSNGRSNVEVVREMIKAGVKIIQYREKEKKQQDKYYECLELRRMTAEAQVTFVVNDDVDIAMLVGADGVHIGQDDLPIKEVRALVGSKMIIGVSTHSPEQAMAAVKGGADYIGVGPIYKTYTKKDVCEPVGLEYLDYVVKNVSIPFVAIGGIKENNLKEVVAHGAHWVAMVTAVVGANNIEECIKKVNKKILEGVV